MTIQRAPARPPAEAGGSTRNWIRSNYLHRRAAGLSREQVIDEIVAHIMPSWTQQQMQEARGGLFELFKRAIDIEKFLLRMTRSKLQSEDRGRLRATYTCPLHDEVTGSFVVDREAQTWYCYGACQTGGSLIDLVMDHYELQTPMDALQAIAGYDREPQAYTAEELPSTIIEQAHSLGIGSEALHAAASQVRDDASAADAHEFTKGELLRPAVLAGLTWIENVLFEIALSAEGSRLSIDHTARKLAVTHDKAEEIASNLFRRAFKGMMQALTAKLPAASLRHASGGAFLPRHFDPHVVDDNVPLPFTLKGGDTIEDLEHVMYLFARRAVEHVVDEVLQEALDEGHGWLLADAGGDTRPMTAAFHAGVGSTLQLITQGGRLRLWVVAKRTLQEEKLRMAEQGITKEPPRVLVFDGDIRDKNLSIRIPSLDSSQHKRLRRELPRATGPAEVEALLQELDIADERVLHALFYNNAIKPMRRGGFVSDVTCLLPTRQGEDERFGPASLPDPDAEEVSVFLLHLPDGVLECQYAGGGGPSIQPYGVDGQYAPLP